MAGFFLLLPNPCHSFGCCAVGNFTLFLLKLICFLINYTGFILAAIVNDLLLCCVCYLKTIIFSLLFCWKFVSNFYIISFMFVSVNFILYMRFIVMYVLCSAAIFPSMSVWQYCCMCMGMQW